MQKEASKNIEHSDIINKREIHYQRQMSDQIKKIKQLEEQVASLKQTLKSNNLNIIQNHSHSFKSLDYENTQPNVPAANMGPK